MSWAPEPRPKTDEEYQDERKRELLLDDKVEAQRRDFRV
jgi:hypothetical protein